MHSILTLGFFSRYLGSRIILGLLISREKLPIPGFPGKSIIIFINLTYYLKLCIIQCSLTYKNDCHL